MPFQLAVRPTISVPVAGALAGEAGAKPVGFNFRLLCKRLNQSQIDEAMANPQESLKAFLHRVVEGWEDVLDAKGEALPFDADSLDSILEEAGMRTLCFNSYIAAVGVKASI